MAVTNTCVLKRMTKGKGSFLVQSNQSSCALLAGMEADGSFNQTV